MARNLLALVFILVSAKAIVDTSNNPRWWLLATNRELELTLRTVQAIAIVALVVLFLFYSIPFGRNLRGILFGYGLFIGESLIWVTLVPTGGENFPQLWRSLHTASYFVVLGIWLAHLWLYAPSPEPRRVVQLEQHYQRVADATSQQLREVRGYLAKAVRQ